MSPLNNRAVRLAAFSLVAGSALGAGAGSQPEAARQIAVINDAAIGWDSLQDRLTEAAGGLVLEEVVLERAARDEADKRGVGVGETEVDAERRLLGDSLAEAAGAPAEETETLIAEIRRARGLGDVRFRSLLETNALLRALVRDGALGEPVRVTQEDVEQAYRLKHGPRLRTRLILVDTLDEANEVSRRLAAGEPFGEVASGASLDPSGAQGGLVPPFSTDDPAYPVGVRRAAEAMEPGQTSAPISVSWGDRQGYVVIKLEERIPARPDAPTLDQESAIIEREVRMVRERAAMDRLARRLLDGARVTVFDRPLGRAWDEWRAVPAR